MTSLYGRRAEGRIDSWHLMDINRGRQRSGLDSLGVMSGRDYTGWEMHYYLMTKFLKATRGTQGSNGRDNRIQTTELQKAVRAFNQMIKHHVNEVFGKGIDFARWLSRLFRRDNPT